jgi:chromosome segregation protein
LADDLNQALALQTQLESGQIIVTLDGYHVGQDWVIALDYDEDSQSSGVLSHRIRLDEIEQLLASLEPELEQLELRNSAQQQQLNIQLEQIQQYKHLKQQQKRQQQLELSIAKYQSTAQALCCKSNNYRTIKTTGFQLEEDAMQRDDLEIDLHALNLN